MKIVQVNSFLSNELRHEQRSEHEHILTENYVDDNMMVNETAMYSKSYL